MQEKRIVSILTILIIILGIICVLPGLLSDAPAGPEAFTSVHGEQVQLYGRGIYAYDSMSMALQGRAQDLVTGIVGLPLLTVSLVLFRRDSFRGRMLLTGTVGYFLYTYVSCTFLWQFNVLFPAYVLLMSISLSTFVILLAGTDLREIRECFSKKAPIRMVGWFEIVFALILLILWSGRLWEAYASMEMRGLEHYTTFVIQALDLGFVVPAALVGGALLLKGKTLGYLISSVILMKGLTMGLALLAMMVSLATAGMVRPVEFAVFGLCIVFLIYLSIRWIASIKDVSEKNEAERPGG